MYPLYILSEAILLSYFFQFNDFLQWSYVAREGDKIQQNGRT